MGRFHVRRARKRALNDQLTPEDVPFIFPWTKNPTPKPEFGGWEGFQAQIGPRLRTEHHTGKTLGRMRKDTKRLLEIEKATEKLVESLRLGASLETAAAYAGIRPAEFREWLALGHTRPRSVYAAFLTLIQEAMAQCEVSDLKVLSDAAKAGEWKAAEARLKLRNYGQSQAPEKKPVNVKVINYNFGSLPPRALKPPVIDLDTFEVQEIPNALEDRSQSGILSIKRENVDERGETAETGSSHRVQQEAASQEEQAEDESEILTETP